MGMTIFRPGQRLFIPNIRAVQMNVPVVPWQNNGTWSAAVLPFSNTPTLGSELLTNTEFTSNVTGWTALNSATQTRRDYSSSPNIAPTGGSDNFGIELSSGGVSAGASHQQPTVVAGTWYQFTARCYSPSANTATNTAGILLNGTTALQKLTTAEDTWTTLTATGRFSTTTASFRFRCNSTTAGDLAHFDAPSAKAITLNTLYNVRAGASLPSFVVASGNVVGSAVAGVVYGMDSISSPTNLIQAVHDGGTGIRLEKMVAGTISVVLATTATYVAGVLPKVRWVSANTFALDYNGVQRGVDQTISDAGTGLLHGVISTSPLTTFTSVTVI